MEQKKILLVDDVRLFLNLEETFFRRTGCRIFTAQNGKEAIDIAKREKPELILLDLLMPEMDGSEACRTIKRDPELKNTKIIMVTTQSDEETVKTCRAAGCDDYVTKPINQRDLLQKAANLLGIPFRVHFRILIRIEVEGESEQGFFMGTSSDISLSGIMIETDKKINLNSNVVMQFVIPGENRPMRLRGAIARVDNISFRERFGIGIHFEPLNEVQKQALAKFIKSRVPDSREL